ncbi:hypothetical protein C7972_11285 [Arenibacter sp. ARW7G5Y1]|nr:hypothetical protein C7972_11285 [Arenibacter sp. ARW7G5Y1]
MDKEPIFLPDYDRFSFVKALNGDYCGVGGSPYNFLI